MASTAQIGLIHGLKKKAGLDDEAYRGLLRQFGGVASSRDLTVAAAIRVIDRLKVVAGEAPSGPRPSKGAAAGSLALQGPFVGKLRALWLTAWNLALTESRTDQALAAFVGRQTGIDSPSWVRDPADARKAIEGLKAWIARESGLEWPKDGRDLRALKYTLVRRQWQLLIDEGMETDQPKWHALADFCGEVIRRASPTPIARPVISATLVEVTPEQFDLLASALGARLRKWRSPAHREIIARGAAARAARSGAR